MPNPILDGLKQAQPADPMKALQKATSIGPPHMGERPLPTPAEEANPIARFIDMTGLSGQDALGSMGPGEAIAVGGPANIPILKAKGKELVDKVIREGLEARSLGQRPRMLAGDKVGDYSPNKPVPETLAKALQYAQQRYPRLFGHVTDLAGVDAFAALKHFPQSIKGSTMAEFKSIDPAQRMSRLAFNPELAEPDTVGHELLHVADRLVYGEPNMTERYKFSQNLPGGYNTNSYEVRARNAGESFANRFSQAEPTLPPLPSPRAEPPSNPLVDGLKAAKSWLFGRSQP